MPVAPVTNIRYDLGLQDAPDAIVKRVQIRAPCRPVTTSIGFRPPRSLPSNWLARYLIFRSEECGMNTWGKVALIRFGP